MVKRLAVVGAGTGGTFAANFLASRLRDRIRSGEVEVLLFGDGFRHYFQPANLEAAFKGAQPDGHSRAELDLLRSEVSYTPDPATRIDLANRSIATEDGTTGKGNHTFDYLIMATGAELAPELIPGLGEGALTFHDGPWKARMIWDAVRSFKSGRIAVAIAGLPYKCPPSPDEALFMLDDHFRKAGVRKDVELTLLTPYPRSYPAAKIAEVVGPLFEERGIKTVPFFNVDSVDPQAKKVYSLEGDEFAYDLLIAIPPHRGAKVVRDSGFGDGEGWIPTDRQNLRIKGYDDAMAIGDATDIPISKSGVVAHLESKVAAMNVAAALEGNSYEYRYNGRINCPMEVGGNKAIFVSATYDREPSEQTPSRMKYAMKKGFETIYWSTLRGTWEWLMDTYFGETSEKAVMGK